MKIIKFVFVIKYVAQSETYYCFLPHFLCAEAVEARADNCILSNENLTDCCFLPSSLYREEVMKHEGRKNETLF